MNCHSFGKTELTEEDGNLAAVIGSRSRHPRLRPQRYRLSAPPGARHARERRARAGAEHRGDRQQRQLADPARRRNLAERDRKPDFRTRKPARPAARRRPARPARDLRLCPAQPGRDEIHAHDRRQCDAVETRRRRPSQQLTPIRDRRLDRNASSRSTPADCALRRRERGGLLAEAAFELADAPCRDQEQALPIRAAEFAGTNFDEKRSAGQYRSDSVAQRYRPGWAPS